MPELTLYKMVSNIGKGKTEGDPVFLNGRQVRFLGVPPRMASKSLTFKGSFDGTRWFPVRTANSGGAVLLFSTAIMNPPEVLPVQDAPAMLPLTQSSMMEGITMIIPVTDKPDKEDRAIEFYLY